MFLFYHLSLIITFKSVMMFQLVNKQSKKHHQTHHPNMFEQIN